MALLRGAKVPGMTVNEVPRQAKAEKPPKLKKVKKEKKEEPKKDEGQTALDLFGA